MHQEGQNIQPSIATNQYCKALAQSITVNNFSTHFQFSRDLGIEFLKGSANLDQIETLKKSIEGIKEYISLLEVKLENKEI